MSSLPETSSRRGLLAGLVLGLPVIGYGVRGVLVDADLTHPGELGLWIGGLNLVNDIVLLPLAVGVGWIVRRVIPVSAWPPVRAGLAATGLLFLVAWPFVRGYGRDPSIPSLLPRDYGAGLAVAVAVVWGAVGTWILVGAVVRRRRSST